MLFQAHSYLSGLLLGMRLLRLLSRCHGGAGARTRHHVLAQWEMGLHRRALRLSTLRPKEVCCQGDLERFCVRRWCPPCLAHVLSTSAASTDTTPLHRGASTGAVVTRLVDGDAHFGKKLCLVVFFSISFCVVDFHNVAAVFMQLCEGTTVVAIQQTSQGFALPNVAVL